MDKHCFLRKLSFVLLVVTLLAGCMSQKINTKSSVMEYLYPDSGDTVVEPATPHLKLPLRVGIAFVPESTERAYGHNVWTGERHSGSLDEVSKADLLERVAEKFRGLDFVRSIEVIPTAYLTPRGGFANLSQIKTMYGIDVIALVSYDQIQFTDEGMLSLSYWTIVGAYLVSGSKNDTSTLMDTVVYDIESQKMLFRAPGTSHVSGRSTPVNLGEQLRADSLQSFSEAATNMTEQLNKKLAQFKESVKKSPDQTKISYREGYTGGSGALGLFECAFIVLLGLLPLWRRR